MYANLCGFRTWDEIAQVIGTQPSPFDESLEKEILESRRATYTGVLVEIFGLRTNLNWTTYVVLTFILWSARTSSASCNSR